jgi:hypothetical protein
MHWITVTGLGEGVPTPIGSPSFNPFFSRSSTGSMPSFSASLFIWVSAMNKACGAPKPRNAAPGTLLV